MKQIRLILAIIFTFCQALLFGQEVNCNNGVDDDGDGFIDCYDGDCFGTVECEGFFISDDADCSISPPALLYEMQNTAGSSNRNVHTQARIAVGDIDGDGIPDIITPHKWDQEMRILWGGEGPGGEGAGTTKVSASTSAMGIMFQPELEVAIANLDDDNCSEIFSIERSKGTANGNAFNGNYYLASYDCNLNLLYRVDVGPDNPGIIGVADFNGDGEVEIYYRNEIRDARTGALIASDPGAGDWNSEISWAPVAVDILDDSECANCSGLELVVGGTIYSVDVATGTMTVERTLADYYTKDMGYATYSTTSVADFNGDGNLDVIISGATGSNTGPTAVFYWDVANNTYSVWETPNDWLWGTGRINIADVNSDGNMNATFVTGNRMYMLQLDGSGQLEMVWEKILEDSQSGIIGITTFDFDNDGIKEIVYRDAGYLTIADGATGNTLKQLTCQSHTFMEYPLIADVNGDGNTNIVVPCNFSDNTSAFDINDGLQQQGNGNIRIYEATGETWVPTRDVWNQHGYHITNVNDDITIPRVMQDQGTIFSGIDCSSGTITPLNGFMNQTPALNASGCPTLPAADIVFLQTDSLSSALTIHPPVCPETDFSISFNVGNIGDVSVSDNIYISFYSGDPRVAGATKLSTEVFTVTDLAPGDSIVVDSLTIVGSGAGFSLYAVLDDDGTTALPLTLPVNPDRLECDFTNNIDSAFVIPLPFALGAIKLQDNIKCDDLAPDNGALSAYVLQGTDTVTTGFTFNWFQGTTISPTPDFTGPIYSGLADSTYTVYAVNDGAGCSSDTLSLTINRIGTTPTVIIWETAANSNCVSPNGALQAGILSGSDTLSLGYNFQWFEGNAVFTSPEIAVGSVVTNLLDGTYSVFVTDLATGCSTISSVNISGAIVIPTLTANVLTHIIDCNDPSGGSVTANVAGDTINYVFDWYVGDTIKSVPDFTGATYQGLIDGNYTVQATNIVSDCPSLPITITVLDQRIFPVININLDALQTSCDPLNPNGALSASVDETLSGGGAAETAGYTFSWYIGQNTIDPPAATGASVSGLASAIYTVKVTDIINNCFSIDTIVLGSNLVIPVVEVIKLSDLTQCTPINGSLSAHVGNDTLNYTFDWYIGGGVKLTPDFTGATYSGLIGGDYTVTATSNLACISIPVTATIIDQRIYPAITITDIKQTSCATPNGQLNSQIFIGAVPQPDTDYILQWYSGATTTDPQVAAGNGGNTSSITAMPAGTYTVSVTNIASQCIGQSSFYLADSITIPVITAADVDSLTRCDTPNGMITIRDADITPGNAADYVYTWYLGSTVNAANIIAGETGPVISGLDIGSYTVTAINSLSCSPGPMTFIINDARVYPNVTFTPVKQTSCDVTRPNGQLTAVVDIGGVVQPAGNYTYDWYIGSTTGINLPAANVTGANNEVADSLSADFYTIVVTDIVTNCTDQLSIYLADSILIPTMSLTATAITDCTPGGGGIVDAEISINSVPIAPADYADYTFTWYRGSVVAPGSELANTDNSLTELSPGVNLPSDNYTVMAINNLTLCTADTQTIFLDGPPAPLFTIDFRINQQASFCAGTDGAITAWVDDGTENVTDYTFEWYEGSPIGTTPTSTFYTDPTLSFTGPVLDVDINGVDPGGTGGYVGAFYSAVSATSGPTLFGRADGNYTVVVTDNTTGCREYLTIALPFVSAHTIQSTTIARNVTRCNLDNGEIDVTISNLGINFESDFTIELYNGTNALGLPAISVAGGGGFPTFSGLAVGYYTVVAVQNFGSNCPSTPFTMLIENDAQAPLIALNTIMSNTWCPGDDGAIQVTASAAPGDDDSNNYDFEWTSLVTNSVILIDNNLTTSIATGLSPGDYKVLVTNRLTGCLDSAFYNVSDEPAIPVIVSTTVVDKDLCSPSGSIAVSDGDISPGNAEDFDYRWFEGTANLNAGVDLGIVDSVLNVTNYPNLTAGITYYVIATKKMNLGIGSGCSSAPRGSIINDITIQPMVSLVPTTNNACDPAQFNGSIAATATTGGVPALGGYSYAWTDASGNPVGGNLVTISGLAPGQYTVLVTDITTSCTVSASSTIIDEPIIPTNLVLSTLPQDLCSPSGSLIVTGISPGVPADYSYQWYRGLDNLNNQVPIAGVTGAVLDNITYANIGTDTYYVIATKNIAAGAGCPALPVEGVIGDITVDPVVTLTVIGNNACDPAQFNGSIQATATTGGIPAAGGYTYAWTDAVGNPVGGNSPLISGLTPGQYQVLITDIATSCTVADAALIVDEPITPVVITFGKTDQDTCLPSGSISVADISPGTSLDYTFRWYRGLANFNANMAIPGATGPVLDVAVYPTIGADIYYLVAIKTSALAAGCESPPAEMEILDISVPPSISFQELALQTSCDPGAPNGSIGATADGGLDHTDPNYNFYWYAGGQPVSGANIGTTSILTGLPIGAYSVVVENLFTGCSDTATFNLGDNIQLPLLFATAQPVTDCLTPNGQLSAFVPNAVNFGFDYTFEWYSGAHTSPPSASPVYTGTMINNGSLAFPLYAVSPPIQNVPLGTYTVFALEQGGNQCISEPFTVSVDDGRIIPDINIIEDSPLTNCDPNRPNGQLSAFVNGNEVIGYTFEWFLGSNPTGSIIHSGNTLTQLTSTTYTVLVTNTLNNCSQFASYTVTEDFPVVPAPDVNILSHLTDCVNPDGKAEAWVSGSSANHIFEWFEGSDTNGPVFFAGSVIDGLNPGSYTLLVTDISNGCSAQLTTEILDERVYPEFEFVVKNATCEQSSGSVEIRSTNDLALDEIIWDTFQGQILGAGIFDFPSGEYSVTVTGVNNCSVSETAIIGIDVMEFNGVSPNGDGDNDYFEVACIESFPDNLVKIFNRNGTLVYEMQGYDNNRKFFDGIANRGISLMGKDLPDGTYFYIIDKRDGSKPIPGYLELLR